MDAQSEGGVILPTGGIPVDPKRPEKGTLTPVMNAQQLTQGVLTALGGLDSLNDVLYGFVNAMRGTLVEFAEELENLAILVADGDPPESLTDRQDEAWHSLQQFVANLAEARAEAAPQEAPSAPAENPEDDGDGA